MRSSEKRGKNKALRLEIDLLLSQEDLEVMKKPVPHDRQDLDDYLYFLEDIGAFETKKIKTKFYDAEFGLWSNVTAGSSPYLTIVLLP